MLETTSAYLLEQIWSVLVAGRMIHTIKPRSKPSRKPLDGRKNT